jgi:hypothetical protein
MNHDRRWKFFKGIKILAIAAVAITAFGYATEQLWNWLMPNIFGLRAITFSQAIGLVVLSKILFGGFGGRGGGPGRNRWKERWEQMSDEDRERFRAGMLGRRGCRPRGESEPIPETGV